MKLEVVGKCRNSTPNLPVTTYNKVPVGSMNNVIYDSFR